MSELTIAALISATAVILGAILVFINTRQKIVADHEAEERKEDDERDNAKRQEEARIMSLMVDDFKAKRIELGDYTLRYRAIWDELTLMQKANIDCERRCAELNRKLADIEHEVTNLKQRYKEGST
jgi:hypothetical protein